MAQVELWQRKRGNRERRRIDEEREQKKKEREKVGKDLHMVSCWSPSMVTVDICRALLGLISRTQL